MEREIQFQLGYVHQALESISKRIADQDAFIRDHMDKEEKKFSDIHKRITSFDKKIYMVLIGTVISIGANIDWGLALSLLRMAG